MPWSARLLFFAAALCALAAVAAGFGLFAPWAPWLDGEGGVLALVVSAIAFAGSGAFPWVLHRLQRNDYTPTSDKNNL